MSADDDAGKRADELECEAAEMRRRSEQLGNEIGDVRNDWQRKRAAADVPGAVPPEPEGSQSPDDAPATEAPSQEGEPLEESPSESG